MSVLKVLEAIGLCWERQTARDINQEWLRERKRDREKYRKWNNNKSRIQGEKRVDEGYFQAYHYKCTVVPNKIPVLVVIIKLKFSFDWVLLKLPWLFGW